jgi:hypothetical protein
LRFYFDILTNILRRTQECLDAMQLALKSSDAENLPRSPLDAAGEYRLQPLKVSAASQSIQPMREALTEI